MRAAQSSCPIEIAARVKYQIAERKSSIESVSEVVERAVRPTAPRASHLENRTEEMRAVLERRAINIAAHVTHQGAIRTAASSRAVQEVESPTAARRRQLENRAAKTCPAKKRAAIEIAGGVEHQTGDRLFPVSQALKVVNQAFHPAGSRRCQLEDRAKATRTAAASRAIEIARTVEDDATVGKHPITAACELVKSSFRPASAGACQLEDSAAAETATTVWLATEYSRPIQVARCVENEVPDGLATVTGSRKAVKHGFRPTTDWTALPHLENHSAAGSPASGSAPSKSLAVETAVRTYDYPGSRRRSVTASSKGAERSEDPAGPCVRQFEDGAVAGSAGKSGAVEGAGRIYG